MSNENPESGFCLTFQMVDKNGVETMFTCRAPQLSDWKTVILARDKIIADLIGNGWSTAKRISAPTQSKPESSGQYTEFDATQIVKTFDDDGRLFIKIKGGRFQKHGVPVYEEDFDSIPVDLEAMRPGTHDFRHRVRAVLKEDGNPRKIVEVLD